MTTATAHSRKTLDGTFWSFLADALIFPTGLLTTGFLTRHLGPSGYGIYTLAAIIVAWIEWGSTSAFYATVRHVSEADDWHPPAVAIIRLHFYLGIVLTVLLVAVASPIAAILHEPSLAGMLRLFSLDIPLFCLAAGYRVVLIGVGMYRQRALCTAARWIGRLLMIVLFVKCGLSVTGAVLGSVGASAIELAISARLVRPPVFRAPVFPMRRLWDCALSIFLFSTCLRVYDRLDIMTLKALGATTAHAGIYSAAQNIALIPAMFGFAYGPLLLSSLTRAIKDDDSPTAKRAATDAMRATMLIIPLCGVIAGAAHEIVRLCFGEAFSSAAPIMSWLFCGSTAGAIVYVGSSVLIAGNKPAWSFGIAGPMLVAAFIGYRLIIPQHGSLGAASVYAICLFVAAIAMLVAVRLVWSVTPPIGTLMRGMIAAFAAYRLGAAWSAFGLILLVKLAVLTIVAVAILVLLGEFRNEIAGIMQRRAPHLTTASPAPVDPS